MVLFCASMRRDSVSLLKFLFLSHAQYFFSLEMPIQLCFIPFLFSVYFCSVDACNACIISDFSLLPRYLCCFLVVVSTH